jgi:eukaryotic-like serine/threonine-protein kinase
MPTITGCPDVSILEQLLLGQVPAAEAEALALHVAACSRCAGTLQQIRVDDPLVDAMRHLPSANDPEQNQLVQALIPCLKRLQANDAQRTLPHETQHHEPAQPTARFDFLAPAEAADEIGRLGSYRVLRPLGAGGMGVVFLADDPRLKRRIALKVIKPELVQRPEVRERFLREAQAVAQVEHDNIVAILHVEEAGGVPFLAMPLLRGESLEERLVRAGGPLPLDETLRIARETAAGLAVAHERGLVHRDIKPANLFLALASGPASAGDSTTILLEEPSPADPADDGRRTTDDGLYKVKILDFGLARAVREEEAGLSQRGQVVGTPAYMAPEQGRGQAVDRRADLFSLGCVLYRMATGRPAFCGDDFVTVLLSVAMDHPPKPREVNPAVPPALAQLIEQLLAKKPEDRPPSAGAVVEAIQAIERQRAEARQPKPWRRRWLIAAAAAALVGLGLWAWLAYWGTRTPSPLPQKPGEVTFDFDEPDVQLALWRGDAEEAVLDPKEGLKRMLLPGTYRIRTKANQEGRRLAPDELVVKEGEAQTITLRLVGQIAKVGGFNLAVTGVAASARKEELTLLASSLDMRSVLGVWDGKSDSVMSPGGSFTPMECVAFAPDGVHAATAGGKHPQKGDTRIHLWDIRQATPQLLDRLAGHQVFVKALAYSPKGTRLLSGDASGVVLLWNLEIGKRQGTLKGHTDVVHGIAFSPDGRRALTCGSDRQAIIWDSENAEAIRRLPHPGKVFGVAFGPGGNEVTTACDDGLVRAWDLKADKVREWKGHVGGVRSVAVSPDGKRLLSGGEDGTIRLWDADRGDEKYAFRPGEAPVNAVAFTADGRRAVSGGADRVVRLWELPR